MPSTQHLILISVLVGLLVNGSPIPNMVSDFPTSGWTSGEELETDSLSSDVEPSPKWEQVIKLLIHEVTTFRDEQFVKEFLKPVKDMPLFAAHHVPSIPEHLPNTPCFANYSKVPCLQQISRGLHVYQVLLQHVENEYPKSTWLPSIKQQITVLKELVKNKLNTVVVDNLSTKEHLLSKVPTTTEWQRKTSVHAILRDLRHFLVDTKRALCRMGAKWEGC
ncbi:hypothetical protein UPYG_G00334950 [Umbra pygmaea]|uniref:Interleukin-6 n=1 Tax=Umbra pygmaea TaxID=75934 RepID=A0ABD0VWZ3_UMBPY